MGRIANNSEFERLAAEAYPGDQRRAAQLLRFIDNARALDADTRDFLLWKMEIKAAADRGEAADPIALPLIEQQYTAVELKDDKEHERLHNELMALYWQQRDAAGGLFYWQQTSGKGKDNG